jgi:hypothetical protein
MTAWRKIQRFLDEAWVEWGMFALGVLLIIAGLIIAPIPGPGGVFLIAPGLALILKTSMWAKRRYARLKKVRFKVFGRNVAPGHWTDLALRRRSALRRERIRKERAQLDRDGEAIAGD